MSSTAKNSRSRSLRISVLIALLFVLVLGLVSCGGCGECTHESTRVDQVQAPTCTEAGSGKTVCNDCGEELGTVTIDATGHNYAKDTAASVASTCTVAGKDVFKCTVCADTYETTLPLLTHNYAKDTAASVASTCTVAGKDVFKCSLCQDTYETALSVIPHSLAVVAAESSEATCTTAGVTVKKCATCTATERTVTPALGHDWALQASARSAVTLKAADCVARKCNRCQEEALATVKHDHKLVSDTATCEQAGTKTYTCAACNDTYTEASAAKGHTVKNWELDTSFAPVPVAGCTYTYQNKGTCETCGTAQTSQYNTDVHKFELKVKVEATCVTPGQKVMTCECGVETGSAVSYYAEHTFVDVAGVMTCSVADCGEKRVTVSGNSAELTPEQLAGEVELGEGGAVIRLPDTIAGQVSGNAQLGAETLGKNEVPAGTAGLDRVGENDTIYNLTLTEGETAITSFQNKVSVKLPYTLGADEDPARVTIFYLGENGIELIEAVFTPSAEGSNEGYVSFETDHFSYYLVGLYADSELCARFGHNYLISSKPATCTENGHYVESCKRCGAYGERKILPATGHFGEKQATSVAATCTTNGHDDYKCGVCQEEYSVVIVAIGHKFMADPEQSLDATCEAPGKKVESCAICQESHSFTLPQRAHDMRPVVTAATCTTGGYTTYSCATCDYEYEGNFVAALGHKWDIAAPTCAHGQICLTCQAKGAPATAQHTMVDGQCSVCGYGCQHTDAVKSTVAPGCTEGGYTIYACSKCAREEKRDYTAPVGHAYPNNFEACTVCGAENTNTAVAVENLLKSLASTGYTLHVEDILFKVKSIETHGSAASNEMIPVDIALSLGELYISVEEGKLLVYMNGSATYAMYGDAAASGAITAYGDGTFLYAKVATGGKDASFRFSYDAMISSVIGSLPLPGPGEGGQGGAPAVIEEPGTEIEEEGDMTIADSINAMLEGILANPLVTPWIQYLQEKLPDIYEGIGDTILYFFTGERVEGGYKYTFNFDKFRQYNKDLHDLTVAAFLDKYCGEGTTEEIFAYLEALQYKKVNTFVTELVLFANEKGLPVDLVISTVNAFMGGGDPTFDIMDYVSAQFQGVTMLNLYDMLVAMANEAMAGSEDPITLPAYDELIALVKETITTYTAYEAIPEEAREQMFAGYDALLNKELVSFSFTTDKDGKLVRIDGAFNEFSFTGGSENRNSETGIVNRYETQINLNASVSLLFSATLPADAATVATEFETTYAAFETAVKTGFAAGDGSPLLGTFVVAEIEEGVEAIFVVLPGEGAEPVMLPLSSVMVTGLKADCTNTVSVMIMSNPMAGGVMLYLNTATGTIGTTSPHLYNIPYEGNYPAGYYKTFDEAPCDAQYGPLYACACGDFVQDVQGRKTHMTYDTVTLLGATCTDGAIVTTKCYYCSYTYHREATNKASSSSSWSSSVITIENVHACNETILEIPTNHAGVTGKTYIKVCKCPCGWTEHVRLSGDHYNKGYGYETFEAAGGCQFNEYSTDNIGAESYRLSIRFCAIEGCNLALVAKVYNSVVDAENCTVTVKTEYKLIRIPETGIPADDKETEANERLAFFESAAAVKDAAGDDVLYVCENSLQYHVLQTLTSKDTDTHRLYYTKCQNCSLQDYEEAKWDGYGRNIYSFQWRKMDGAYVRFYESKTVYYASPACKADHYYRDNPNEKLEFQYTGESHMTTQQTLIPGTCTQPGIIHWVCVIPGCDYVSENQDYSWYWHTDGQYRNGHYWMTNVGPEPEFDYYCRWCGLESNRGDGMLSLEDLTQNATYATPGEITIGYNGDYWSRLEVKYAFVAAGENFGAETTVTLPAVILERHHSFSLNNGQGYASMGGIGKEEREYDFGTFSFRADEVRTAAQSVFAEAGCESVEEFLAAYDLAIILEDIENPMVGNGQDGTYTVIVLTDLPSYMN